MQSQLSIKKVNVLLNVEHPMWLPNLSMLSIDAPKRQQISEDDDFAPAKKAKKEVDNDGWTRINQMSFPNMVAKLRSFSKAFYSLSITTDPNDPNAFRYEFKLEYFATKQDVKLRMNAIYGVTPCVEVIINLIGEDVIVKDLFYETNKIELLGMKVLCDMTPQRDTKAGAGDQILSIATLIATQLGYSVSLYDAAKFTPSKKPKNAIDDYLSIHQGLTRGYGYYQARGFVNRDNFDAAEKELGEVNVSDYEDIMQFELDFVHLAVNTKLDSLYDTMRIGHLVLNIPASLKKIYTEDDFFKKISTDNAQDLRLKMENLDYHLDNDSSMLTPELAALRPFEELSLRKIHKHYEAIQQLYFKAYGQLDLLFMLDVAFEEIRKICFPDPILEIDEKCFPTANMSTKKTFRDETTGEWFEVVPQIDPNSGVFKRPITVRRPVADSFFVKIQ